MLRNPTRLVVGLAAAALLVPGAALAKPGHGHGHGQFPTEPAGDTQTVTTDTTTTETVTAPTVHGHGKHLAKGHAKPHKLVVKGTVVSIGAAPTSTETPTDPTATAAADAPATDTTATTVTIHVTRANHHGRALVGQDVTFTIPEGGVRAADSNGDGNVDLSDVKVGDKVLVQTRKVAVDAAQPFAARKLVDQTSPETEDPADAAEAPEAPAPPAT